MIRNRKTKKSISAYVDSELSESKSKEIKKQLKESISCQKYYKDILMLNKILDSYSELEFSPELKSTILNAVKDKVIYTEPVSQYHLWNRLKKNFISLSSAAMIFLALTIGFFLGNALFNNNDETSDYFLSDNSFYVIYEQIIEDSNER
ncbi:MAG: hypothetical protein DRH57_07160 [Candidatus Cloacimonadota bacterium]|nr:MAG: hypothetical protein DRH57_07160 [Candidatus Cloacimonadota bacterium]